MTSWSNPSDPSSSYTPCADPGSSYDPFSDTERERVVDGSFSLPQAAWSLAGLATIDQDIFKTGPDALSLQQTHGSGSSPGSTTEQENIPLDVGELFQCVVWFHPNFAFESGPNYDQLRIRADHGDGVWRNKLTVKKSQVSLGWQSYSFEFTAAGVNGRLSFLVLRTVGFPPAVGVGRWLVDDVSLKRATIYTECADPGTSWS